jgi:methionine sulfoxide reductase catalytic subunit
VTDETEEERTMWIKRRRGWELPEQEASDERLFWNRRRLLQAAAGGTMVAATSAAGLHARHGHAQSGPPEDDPSAGLYPASRNDAFGLSRPVTEEEVFVTYTNYYEFGSSKNIWRHAQELPIRPWTVRIDGMVEREIDLDIDDLLARVSLEERLYRLRCVEAWSMAVPWTGFPMRELVALARPLSSASYVRMETFHMPDVASGQRAPWYPWPYIEGLTMEEATHDLALLATGAYGKPLAQQNGSPLRLVVPWKYGFKSIKGIVRFTFTDQQPETFWETVQGGEYGFWANVNPAVAHPRWSQAEEKFLRSTSDVGFLARPEVKPTLAYNGYGEQVAHLYQGLEAQYGDRLYR